MTEQRLLTAQELAERLNVSVGFVYRSATEWPSVRIGNMIRFDYDAVLEYLARVQAEAS